MRVQDANLRARVLKRLSVKHRRDMEKTFYAGLLKKFEAELDAQVKGPSDAHKVQEILNHVFTYNRDKVVDTLYKKRTKQNNTMHKQFGKKFLKELNRLQKALLKT